MAREGSRRSHSHRRSTAAPESRTHRSSRDGRPRTTEPRCRCSVCPPDPQPSPPPHLERNRTATPTSGHSGSATNPAHDPRLPRPAPRPDQVDPPQAPNLRAPSAAPRRGALGPTPAARHDRRLPSGRPAPPVPHPPCAPTLPHCASPTAVPSSTRSSSMSKPRGASFSSISRIPRTGSHIASPTNAPLSTTRRSPLHFAAPAVLDEMTRSSARLHGDEERKSEVDEAR